MVDFNVPVFTVSTTVAQEHMPLTSITVPHDAKVPKWASQSAISDRQSAV